MLSQSDCYNALAEELHLVEQRHRYERTRGFMLERSNEEIVNQQLADLMICRGERDKLKQRVTTMRKKMSGQEEETAMRNVLTEARHAEQAHKINKIWGRVF